MNVYDFDGTIFQTDRQIGFCIRRMKKRHKMRFTFAPKAIGSIILRKTGKMPEHQMQRDFFGYLTMADTIHMNVRDFDEAYQLLESRGFKSPQGDKITDTGSSKSAMMISPSGVMINISEHIRKEDE